MFLASDPATTGSFLTTFGPLIVALGGLTTAIVAFLSRKDKRDSDQATNLNARTDTVLEGLKISLDRADSERVYWQNRAETAEKERDQLREDHETCEEDKVELRRRLSRKPGNRRSVNE